MVAYEFRKYRLKKPLLSAFEHLATNCLVLFHYLNFGHSYFFLLANRCDGDAAKIRTDSLDRPRQQAHIFIRAIENEQTYPSPDLVKLNERLCNHQRMEAFSAK